MQSASPIILVVDDEKEIARAAAIHLQRAGFTPVVACSAAEALEKWSDDIQLLLTDWSMPGLFGDQLALRLLEKKPLLRVMFMSGNPIAAIETSIPLLDGVNFISKPFGSKELVEQVGRCLSASPMGDPDELASNGFH